MKIAVDVARTIHRALHERFGPQPEGAWEVILAATEHAMSEQLPLWDDPS